MPDWPRARLPQRLGPPHRPRPGGGGLRAAGHPGAATRSSTAPGRSPSVQERTPERLSPGAKFGMRDALGAARTRSSTRSSSSRRAGGSPGGTPGATSGAGVLVPVDDDVHPGHRGVRRVDVAGPAAAAPDRRAAAQPALDRALPWTASRPGRPGARSSPRSARGAGAGTTRRGRRLERRRCRRSRSRRSAATPPATGSGRRRPPELAPYAPVRHRSARRRPRPRRRTASSSRKAIAPARSINGSPCSVCGLKSASPVTTGPSGPRLTKALGGQMSPCTSTGGDPALGPGRPAAGPRPRRRPAGRPAAAAGCARPARRAWVRQLRAGCRALLRRSRADQPGAAGHRDGQPRRPRRPRRDRLSSAGRRSSASAVGQPGPTADGRRTAGRRCRCGRRARRSAGSAGPRGRRRRPPRGRYSAAQLVRRSCCGASCRPR